MINYKSSLYLNIKDIYKSVPRKGRGINLEQLRESITKSRGLPSLFDAKKGIFETIKALDSGLSLEKLYNNLEILIQWGYVSMQETQKADGEITLKKQLYKKTEKRCDFIYC